MRKFLQFPLMVVLSVLTFVACDKDDDDKGSGVKNEIEVGSEILKIEKAYQVYDGFHDEDEKLVDMALVILLEKGYVFSADLVLPAENEKLTKGTYTFNDKEEKANTIVGGGLGNIHRTDEDKDDEPIEITDGKIIIDVDGENYTVTLDITLDDENKLTGSFYGKLPMEEDKDDEEESEEK